MRYPCVVCGGLSGSLICSNADCRNVYSSVSYLPLSIATKNSFPTSFFVLYDKLCKDVKISCPHIELDKINFDIYLLKVDEQKFDHFDRYLLSKSDSHNPNTESIRFYKRYILSVDWNDIIAFMHINTLRRAKQISSQHNGLKFAYSTEPIKQESYEKKWEFL